MSTASKPLIADLGFFVRNTPFTSSAALAKGARNCAANLQAGLAGRRALSLRLAKNVAFQLGLVINNDQLAMQPGAVLQLCVKLEEFQTFLELVNRLAGGGVASWFIIATQEPNGADRSQAVLLKLNGNYLVIRSNNCDELATLVLATPITMTTPQYLQMTSANAPYSLIDSWIGPKEAPTLGDVAQLLQCMDTMGITPAAVMAQLRAPVQVGAAA
ncbi:hypothetical protein [Comamonas thiooxydans]|uniref:hypothetical protein n=1 Tax=Comamonas thiooxydans TaxID=363952 RepID=UPI00118524C8|nr:hypothetical protein [Comamonas thiooxydans]